MNVMSQDEPLLKVERLEVHYLTRQGISRAVDGIDFEMAAGENLGFVGESGCGKTTTGRALIRVLPRNGRIAGGRILFKGRDLVALDGAAMQALRWREIAAVPQSAMDSLNPVYRVGDQLAEVLRVRGGLGRREAYNRARELFSLVGLDQGRLSYYPHEFSGGMKQRAAIAMALALNPSLVIADEPVTALDVIVQHQVLQELKRLQSELALSVIMITHDISVVAQTCDRVAVMYAGKIVERGTARQVLLEPYHPYNLGLQNAFPSLLGTADRLVSIEGYPPDLVSPPPGCRFAPRCPFAVGACREEEPAPVAVATGHVVSCHRTADVELLRARAREVETWQGMAS